MPQPCTAGLERKALRLFLPQWYSPLPYTFTFLPFLYPHSPPPTYLCAHTLVSLPTHLPTLFLSHTTFLPCLVSAGLPSAISLTFSCPWIKTGTWNQCLFFPFYFQSFCWPEDSRDSLTAGISSRVPCPSNCYLTCLPAYFPTYLFLPAPRPPTYPLVTGGSSSGVVMALVLPVLLVGSAPDTHTHKQDTLLHLLCSFVISLSFMFLGSPAISFIVNICDKREGYPV